MAFLQKTWKDRVAEYINRRVLTKEDGTTELVSVERSEGTISQEGDAFSAANMNDLEQRIANEFSEQNKNLQWFIDNGYLPDPNNPNIVLYDYGKINENMVADFSATGTGSVSTFTKEANYLYSEAGNASGVLLYTVKPINLNNVKKVHFVMINSSTTNTICLNTTMPSSWVELSKEQPIAVTSSPTDLVMDVTDYNGEYYLCVKTKSLSNTKIYKIYLEY